MCWKQIVYNAQAVQETGQKSSHNKYILNSMCQALWPSAL